jgi:cytochrome c-type biogenesis protein CcmH/NrfF
MRIRTVRALSVAVALLGTTGFAGFGAPPHPAGAQEVDEAQAKAQAERAIARIKSPYCPGLMLEVCPSPQAADLRDSIQAKAARGIPGDSIVELVLADVGEEYRAFPRTRGKELLAWLVPPLGILFGLLIVALVLRRMIPKRPDAPAEISLKDEARVREALEELERAEAMDPWETVGPPSG